ncbi:glycosyltransferase [Mucilaginibacter sp. Bleaf8]|uniref:glycosyltransferase n=1 Tax=Mucilaginibacter sp. Bleaf8 TaxID=2834430 RepID=UPI001BCF3FF8|nr:glycosyltransferase [Mucilaginibacter sp. Bleaf8]MBS7564529.1 glycosyltransferase [Mucilaginibacter sp. Bleaf8]
MDKIRVVFFADVLVENFDGATRTMFQLIKRIPRHRFEFLFVCGAGPDKLYSFECLQIPAVKLPANITYKIALPQLAAQELSQKLQEFKPDVVHIATPSLLGAFAIQFANQQRLPVISIHHTHYTFYVDYYSKWMPFLIGWVKPKAAALKKEFYDRCNMLYVPAKNTAQHLQQLGVKATQIKIWKRGVDTLLFSPRKRNRGLMQYLTGNNNPNVLFTGRLTCEKDLEILFSIYDDLQDCETACNLIIAGDGINRKLYQKRMKNAVFTGKLEHNLLAELYASVDVFVSTAVSENDGDAVLEAMASGLPCVIADGGCAADLIEDGVNGFKCQPNNAADYLERINLLLADDMLYDRIRRKAHSYSKQLDWMQLAEVYFEDISQLAAGSVCTERYAMLFLPGKTG